MIQIRAIVKQIQNLKRDQFELYLTDDQVVYKGEKLLQAWIKEGLDIALANTAEHMMNDHFNTHRKVDR